MPEVKRYHPALVVLHWLLALAIIGMYVFGSFVLDEMENTAPQTAGLLELHLIGGITILLLTFVRLALRVSKPRPAPATSGNPIMDKVATGVHHLLYTLTVLVIVFGLALAWSADLFSILFMHTGTLPKDFEDFTSHDLHGLLADGLMVAVALHVAGALKHQFVLKDNLLTRMSLRRND